MKGFRRMGPLQEKGERLTPEGQEAQGSQRKGCRGQNLLEAAKGERKRLAPGDSSASRVPASTFASLPAPGCLCWFEANWNISVRNIRVLAVKRQQW